MSCHGDNVANWVLHLECGHRRGLKGTGLHPHLMVAPLEPPVLLALS